MSTMSNIATEIWLALDKNQTLIAAQKYDACDWSDFSKVSA